MKQRVKHKSRHGKRRSFNLQRVQTNPDQTRKNVSHEGFATASNVSVGMNPVPLTSSMRSTYFPNMGAMVTPNQFNKTQCNETRYLKHLRDTRVVEIMRPFGKLPMGNVPSK